ETIEPAETVSPKVTNLLPLIPAAEVEAQLLPPQPLAAPDPDAETPLPRVRPRELLTPEATCVAGSPWLPKPLCPLTSQPTSTPLEVEPVTVTVVEATALLVPLVSVATA